MIKIMKYAKTSPEEILARGTSKIDVSKTVSEIINEVRNKGDEALFSYCEKFDGAKIESLEVSAEEIEEAIKTVEPEFLEILKEAAENIRSFHVRQVRNSFIINEKDGVITGQKITPIEKVGLYVPGGTAAYPSTVLMNGIPAKIAGCEKICITTPPLKNGKINPAILAAAKVVGIDRIFKVGGASFFGLRNRNDTESRQNSRTRKRFCSRGKKTGFRTSLNRYDSRTERDFGYRRQKQRFNLCRGRSSLSGGA